MGNNQVNSNIDGENLLEENNAQYDGQVNLYVDQTKLKKTVYLKNPVFIKRENILLERDGFDRNIYYIEFQYDAMVDFQLRILFNARKNAQKLAAFYKFVPSQAFIDNVIKIECKQGHGICISDKSLLVDMNAYMDKKIDEESEYDLVIEAIPYLEGKLEDNIIFYTLCNFQEKERGLGHKLKVEIQKLKAYENWLDIFDVYNSSRDTFIFIN